MCSQFFNPGWIKIYIYIGHQGFTLTQVTHLFFILHSFVYLGGGGSLLALLFIFHLILPFTLPSIYSLIYHFYLLPYSLTHFTQLTFIYSPLFHLLPFLNSPLYIQLNPLTPFTNLPIIYSAKLTVPLLIFPLSQTLSHQNH